LSRRQQALLLERSVRSVGGDRMSEGVPMSISREVEPFVSTLVMALKDRVQVYGGKTQPSAPLDQVLIHDEGIVLRPRDFVYWTIDEVPDSIYDEEHRLLPD